MAFPRTRLALAAALGLTVLASGACTPLRSHQGYVIDADLVNSVQPGIDTRDSVLQTLGRPSFAAQFSQGDWYYIARDSRNYAYNKPHVRDQTTLRISFDPRGVVSGVVRTGEEQVAQINPDRHETPTLGRHRSLLSELFGNIGTVGAGGAQGQGGNQNNTGGGDSGRP